MQINTQAENINFKWNRTTHLEMTMLALKDFDIASSTRRQIARYSQMPDFCKHEHGFQNNTHFYFPDSKKKSFGLKTEKNNALEQFKQHVDCAVFAQQDKSFYSHAGYAIHYLQDVAVPLHTKVLSCIGELINFPLHKSFERGEKHGANKHLDEFIRTYKPEEINVVSMVDLFKDTADFSCQPELQVKRTNIDSWKSIQQACFNRGVDATSLLFKKLIEIREFFNQ